MIRGVLAQVRDLLDGLEDLPTVNDEARAAVEEIRTLAAQFDKVEASLKQKADALKAELVAENPRAYVLGQLATGIQPLASEYATLKGQLVVAKGKFKTATGREW